MHKEIPILYPDFKFCNDLSFNQLAFTAIGNDKKKINPSIMFGIKKLGIYNCCFKKLKVSMVGEGHQGLGFRSERKAGI